MPKRVSDTRKAARGTFRPDRRPTLPTELEAGEPRRPKALDRRAHAIWRAEAPLLVSLGLLTPVDGSVFGRYCQCRADVERLTLEIRDEGEVVESQRGGPRKNPRCLLLREAHDRLSKLEVQLGLTPESRNRVRSASAPRGDLDREWWAN